MKVATKRLHRRTMHKAAAILIFLFVSSIAHAQLVINEVSQGASGTKEYVELVVTGTPSCAGIPTVDLRGWYLDDNNGAHATGSGTGIAPGCLRFTTDALWSAVPIGTIIVVYNNADVNAQIPAQDLSLSDGNCRLVIPAGNCALIEQHGSQPSTANAAYPTTGFSACGLWTTTSMANGDDSYQVINPSGTIVHAVSWGNNTLNTIIYFAGSSGGMVAWNNNAVNTNPALQGNWTRTAVAGNETPGSANNAANAAWIAGMNNNCAPVAPFSATASATGTCACTGTATVSVSGGIAPYTYSWAPSGGNAATETGLCPGSYTCTITDAGGCTQTAIVSVSGSSAPTATVQSVSNVACNGDSTGSATVNASGGAGPYSYSWAPSGGTGATETGLSAGIYTCTITDANGCTVTQTVSLTEPTAITAQATQTNVACRNGNDGAATVIASGGTGPYTYSWNPSGGNNASATSLTAGTYTCIITDANGCTFTQSFSVTQPGGLSVTSTQTNTLCNGDSNGTASVNANGGVGGYTYSWSPSGGTGATESNLAAGTYVCTITDANGCTIIEAVTITQPPLLNATSSTSPAGCAASDGSASAFVNGGTPAYAYTWTPSGGNASTALNLPAGTYTCTVTDANGCTTTVSATVGTTGNPPVAGVTAGGPLSFCQGDSLQLSASGASQFLWSTGDTTQNIYVTAAGNYSVVVINACGNDTAAIAVTTIAPPTAALTASGPTSLCVGDSVTLTASGGATYLWSTGDTTSAVTVTATGTYVVIASDACGSDTVSQQVTVSATPVALITPSGPVNFCAGDSVTLIASGGASYVWSTGATTASIVVTTAGTYTVAAISSCGSDTAGQVITLSPLPVASITAQGPVVFCTGDSVVLTAGGGGNYLWSTGDTAASITVSAAGTYTVAVTNTCGTATAQQAVNVLAVPVAAISASGPTAFCEGNTLTLTAAGGTSYLWSTGSTSAALPVDTAGTFTVIVSNACGNDTAQIATTLLPLPVAALTGNTIICPGETATLNAGGGSSYVWSTGATSASITTGAAGNYFVIASNACGSDTAYLSVQSSLVSAGIGASSDSGQVPFAVQFTDMSTNAVTWNWSLGPAGTSSDQDPAVTFTTPGIHTITLTVTNADGCTDTATIVIIVTDIPGAVTVPNVFTPNADGTNDVFIPGAEGIAEMTMEIFDRWGVLMSTTDTVGAGWDGRTASGSEASAGTYYYVIRAVAYNGQVFALSGFFALIR